MLEKLNTPLSVGVSVTIVLLVTIIAILTMLLVGEKMKISYPCECGQKEKEVSEGTFRTLQEQVISEEISMVSF